MGISGTQPALMYAQFGVLRFGASRFGYTSPKTFITINGVQVATSPAVATQAVLSASVSIIDTLNEIPNTAALTLTGTEPPEGSDVVITLGSINNLDRLYAGTVLNRSHRYVGQKPTNWLADLNVIDYTWQLTRRRVSGSFTNVAPAVVAAAIVAAVPGFTLSVQAGLPTLDAFSYTDVDALAALTALAKRIGGYCDVDYHKVVKLFITDSSVTNPVALTSTHVSLTEFAFTRDLSPVRTRIFVEGGGVTALAFCAIGETIIPVGTTAWYTALGGKIKSGSQHVAYTGIFVGGGGTLVGPGVSPAAAPAVALVIGTGLGVGTYQYVYTDITPSGESLPSPLATITTGLLAAPATAPTTLAAAGAGVDVGVHLYAVSYVVGATETVPGPTVSATTVALTAAPTAAPAIAGIGPGGSMTGGVYEYELTFVTASGETTPGPACAGYLLSGGAAINLFLLAVGPSEVTSRNLYRRFNSTGPFGLVATLSANGTTYTDTLNNSGLGAAAPTVNTATLQRVSLAGLPLGATGVTARKIYRTAAGGSQLKLLATIADNTTPTYTDSTADASLGANALTVGTAPVQQVALSGIGIGASPTTSRKVYRTTVGGSQLKLLTTLADNTTTTYADATADGSLGANAPTGDTSALPQPIGQILAGAASLLVAGAGAFSAAGGWAVIGSQIIRYAGITGNTLTGIPASGVGAIGATITYNATVTAAPAVIGVPASGVGSILYPILPGDPVNLLVQVDDLAAQAALGTLLGGGDDGVVEDWIQDGTIGITEALARGRAKLASSSTVRVSITYKVRDKNTRAGRTIHVSLGSPTNVTADFQIQHVTIDRFNVPRQMPTFTVQASNDRFSLEDLLRVFRQQAA
jgi:hypothetical protein